MNDRFDPVARASFPGNGDPSRPNVSRRAFLRLLAGSTVGATLGACGVRAKGPGPHGSDSVQLVYQDWRTDWFPGMAQKALEQFHALHDNIRVFYTPDPENLDERMLADFQAGTAPDVLSGCCDYFPAWAQQGYLLDLRPYVEADLDRGSLDDWDPAQFAALSLRDGTRFALPKYHGALALFYNKDIFDAFSVDYPDRSWNHDDYLDAMRRLTRDLNGDGETDLWGSMVDIGWDRLQVHINGWGGHIVDPEDPRRCLMGAPEALGALEWLRARMWDDRVMAGFLDVQNLETRQAFIHERLAMVEDGSWSLKDILENARFRVGVAPMPTGPVRRATLATTDGFAVYAGTRYPEAAWELVKFLVGPEYGRAMATAHLLQPARYSLIEEWITHIRMAYPLQTRDLDIGAFAEGHTQGYSVTAEIFDHNMAEVRNLTRAAWEQIFTLGQAPVTVLGDVSAAIEKLQVAAS